MSRSGKKGRAKLVDARQEFYPPASSKNLLGKSKKFFNGISKKMQLDNHSQHDVEPAFWHYMFRDVIDKPEIYDGELAFEFGCGAGRNLAHMLALADFKRVDGLDISKQNARNSQSYVEQIFGEGKSLCLESNGWSCLPMRTENYLLAISHQVFIHIPHRGLRFSILRDICRVLKPGGKAIIHFKWMQSSVGYREDFDGFPKNVSVSKEDEPLILEDFTHAGFKRVVLHSGQNFYDGNYEVFVEAVK